MKSIVLWLLNSQKERKFCNITTIYNMSCLNENIVWYGKVIYKVEMFMVGCQTFELILKIIHTMKVMV